MDQGYARESNRSGRDRRVRQAEPLAARWGIEKFVTTGGEVVGTPGLPVAEEALPMLSGTLSTSAETMQVYGKLSARLAEVGLTLKTLRETDVGGWELTLANGVTVMLGAEDVNGRLERVLAVYADALNHQIARVDRIDARYGSGVAVRWRSEPVEAPLHGTRNERVRAANTAIGQLAKRGSKKRGMKGG